jgi:hypothetical protein
MIGEDAIDSRASEGRAVQVRGMISSSRHRIPRAYVEISRRPCRVVVTAMDASLGDRLADVRDRALLLLGFAGALRRSELVALNVDDISEDDDGLVLLIHKSKTDQERVTTKIGIPYGSHDAGPIRCPTVTDNATQVCRCSVPARFSRERLLTVFILTVDNALALT